MIMAVNTWAVSVLRYGAGVINWTKAELESIDRKTRKQMTIYGMLHPRADLQRFYLLRGQGGRGLKCRGLCSNRRGRTGSLCPILYASSYGCSREGRAATQRKYTHPETTERAERIRASAGLEEQTLAWPVSAPNRGD